MFDVKQRLTSIVGQEFVLDSPDILKSYSQDYSLNPPGMPNYIVQPRNTKEIQEIINMANETNIPVIPSSSGVHFNGCIIPKQGGIILDLRRMNKILDIEDMHRTATIEPGVTWAQLQKELGKKELMSIIPLLPHRQKSVLTSWLEREVPVISKYEYSEPSMSMEVVWPNGEIFRTGSASPWNFPESIARGNIPAGPGTINFYRFLQGAQGTMGVVTWMKVKVEYKPKVSKVLFIQSTSLKELIEPLRDIQRRRIGHECLILESLNLATILSEKWPDDYHRLKQTLAPWTLILILSGSRRHPEEKIAYEEEAVQSIMTSYFPSLQVSNFLPGVPKAGEKLAEMLRQPWPEETNYWKFRYQGGCQDLFCIAPLHRVAEFVEAIDEVAMKYGRIDEVGHYIQSIEYGCACHCEFNFYYDLQNSEEKEKILKLYAEAARRLQDLEAFFSRPYGILADLVYSRAAEYTMVLKKVKNIFDPNNIMCPGNLCF